MNFILSRFMNFVHNTIQSSFENKKRERNPVLLVIVSQQFQQMHCQKQINENVFGIRESSWLG